MKELLAAGLLTTALTARRGTPGRAGLFDVLKALVDGHAERALERERRSTLQTVLARRHAGDEVIETGSAGRRVVRPRVMPGTPDAGRDDRSR